MIFRLKRNFNTYHSPHPVYRHVPNHTLKVGFNRKLIKHHVFFIAGIKANLTLFRFLFKCRRRCTEKNLLFFNVSPTSTKLWVCGSFVVVVQFSHTSNCFDLWLTFFLRSSAFSTLCIFFFIFNYR